MPGKSGSGWNLGVVYPDVVYAARRYAFAVERDGLADQRLGAFSGAICDMFVVFLPRHIVGSN
jgi:hypothetical protein